MKMVKSLLLGSAAGLVAMAGAQAADMPVKAKPVQYVKICSLYGAGFYYIPGTDTCLKVGGFVRAEANFNANGSFNPYRAANFDSVGTNKEVTRVRFGISADARSQTEYGTLRAYLIMAPTDTNGGSANAAAPNAAFGGSPYIPVVCSGGLHPDRRLHDGQDGVVLRLRRTALFERHAVLEFRAGWQRYPRARLHGAVRQRVLGLDLG